MRRALEVLGLDENVVLVTAGSAVRFCRMPTVVPQKVLRQVARRTIETLGVFDAGLREVGS